jgi:hypothetical protein
MPATSAARKADSIIATMFVPGGVESRAPKARL